MRRFAAHVFLLSGLCLFAAGAGMQNAWGAPTGSLEGDVLRPDGSAVPGARITVKNLETDSIQETVTDDSGKYRIADLPLGRYSVVAEVASGKSVALDMVDMAGMAATATAATAAAQISATVVVNAQAPLVEKTHSEIDRTVNTKTVLELPGRQNLYGLALLHPGVVPSHRPFYGSSEAGIINSLNYDRRSPGSLFTDFGSPFAVNGTRPNSNYFTIDGAYNMDPVRGTNLQSMPPEAIQTFQMINGNYPAQVGRFGGSFVDQISRTGSTGFHGTLMYTWAGNSLDALSTDEKRQFNALTATGLSDGQAYRIARSVVVDNRIVASGGFPIWKDKIFSFSSFDRDWFNATANPSTIAITPEGFAELQAIEGNLAPGALDLLASRFPLANIGTNLGVINVPIAVPAPPPPGGEPGDGEVVITDPPVPLATFNRGVLGGIRYDRDYDRFLQRLQFKISSSNSLNLRYLYDSLEDPGFPSAIPGQEIARNFKNHSGQLNDVHIFSPSVINEFRFGITRLADRFDSFLGLGLNIGGFNSVGNPNFPQNRKDTSYQFADIVSWMMGSHSFKIGGDAVHYRMRAIFPFNSFGTLTYASLQDFLTNSNAIFTQYTGDNFIRSNATELGVFVHDDWKVSKSFSLNLGLRYEYMQIPEGFFSGVLPSQKNFGPRFGFAWAPDAGGMFFEKTTIRGGYSLMYNNQVAWQLLPLFSRNFPRGINTAIGPVSGLTTLPDPITVDDFLAAGGNPDLLPATAIVTSESGRFRTPYYQTYTLGLEREFGRDFVFRAYYVGTKGTHLYLQYDANPGVTAAAVAANPAFFSPFNLQPIVDGTGGIAAFRPNPAFGSTMVLDPIANSIYNSGQFSLIKRFSHGVQFGAHYTYSSNISESDNFLIPVPNPFNPRAYSGRSNIDQPHRFVANYTFIIPTIMRDSPLMSRLVSGWELSGITAWASGFPLTVYNAQNALGLLPGQNPAAFTQFASFNPLGVPRTGTSEFDPNPQFIADPTNSGVISNQGRNILRSQRFFNTDVAFVKNTRTFSEDQNLQLRFEVFNLFNRRNFSQVPLSVVNNTTNPVLFLSEGETDALGRSFMFTARYFF